MSADPPVGGGPTEGPAGPTRGSRSRPDAPAPEAGFTLLEALVALLVVGLGVVGAVEAASRALRTQAEVGRRLEAVQLADERLTDLSLLPGDSLAACCAAGWRSVELDDRRYRRRSEVVRWEADPGLWRAAAVVAWDGGSVRLETLLYRPGTAPGAGGGPP